MKDFSIKSILADTCIFKQNNLYDKNFRFHKFDHCEDMRKEKKYQKYSEIDSSINGEENLETSMGNDLRNVVAESVINSNKSCNEIIKEEVCIMNNLKRTDKFGERHNCDVNSRNISEINLEETHKTNSTKNSSEFLKTEVYINSGQCDEHDVYKNSLCVKEVEHDQYRNRWQSIFFNNVNNASDIIEVKPNFRIIHTEKNARNCGKSSKFLIQEKYKFNEISVTKKMVRTEEYKMCLKQMQVEQFSVNYRNISKNNCWKTSKMGDQYKDLVRHLKKDQRRKLHRNQQKQLTESQSEVIQNSKQMNLKEKRNNGLLKYKNNSLKNNLSRQLEEIESRHPLPDNRNRKLIGFCKDKVEGLEVIQSKKQLEWLQFTRYKPPKIPRKPSIDKNKRKPSLHPRIPFSTFQLDFLEQKFQNSAYLLKNDVLDISVDLKLPPNRVLATFYN